MAVAPTGSKSDKTLPGPLGIPVLGNLPEFRRKGLIDFYYDLWRTYGDAATAKLGPLTAFSFVRPEHIQHILVHHPDVFVKGLSHSKLRVAIGNGLLTLEGERWYQQRKLMQPTYTPKGIRGFADLMIEEAKNMLERWQTHYKPDQVIDINLEMTRITMSVISRAMFGVDIGINFRETIVALYELLEYTSRTTNSIIDTPLFIPTPGNRRLKAAKRNVREFIFNIIKQRRTEGHADDLLSMLMTARDEATGEFMTDEQLHDEVLITIFAGHETTASLLTWTLFMMAKTPDIEVKLHQELDQVLQGRTPTPEDVPQLTYARMMLDETLRLYAPVPVIARDTVAETEIDGWKLPKGAMITLVPYATHRHPEFWEKPLHYHPEHFTPEAVASRPRYAYYPFGSGQRICIGIHFAQLEAMLILAEIAQRYRATLAVPNDGAIKFIGVARPKKPIMMHLIPRT